MDFRGKNIDLVGKQNLWFTISAIVVLIGLVSWAAFGLNYGIDFKGGGQLTYLIPEGKRPGAGEAAFLEKTRQTLAAKGLGNAKIQIAGEDTLVVVTDATDSAALQSQERLIRSALSTQLGVSVGEPIGTELVGPVIGRELKKNALMGVILGVLLIATWIYIRYNFAGDGLRYAVAGIFALVHDVFVLLGLFALIGKIDPRVEVDGAFIAALLTVVGYSINDSVVIFDRIRENLRRRRGEFNRVVNDSLLETMSRSINTGLTVIIMLTVMLFFGGESIYNFVLAMLIGIATGLYSSIFNASMVLTAWHSWETKKLEAARAARGGSTPAASGAGVSSAGASSVSSSTPLASGAATAAKPSAARPETARRPSDSGSASTSPRSNKARSRKRF